MSPCCWNRARRLTCFLSASVTIKDLQFGTWTDRLFPTTLSIPSYDIGKYVGLRTYQHPLYLNLAIDVRTSSSSVILRSVWSLRPALFWVITQWLMVISYRRFGTNFATGSPGTLVRNYHYLPPNYPEELNFHLLRAGRLKSLIVRKLFDRITLVAL